MFSGTKSNNQLVTCDKKSQQETKKTENSGAFSKVEHKHDNPVTSLDYAHVNKSIIYVTTRLAKSTHQQVIMQKKKTPQIKHFPHLKQISDSLVITNVSFKFLCPG